MTILARQTSMTVFHQVTRDAFVESFLFGEQNPQFLLPDNLIFGPWDLLTGKFLVSILAEGWLIFVLPVYVLTSLSCLFAAVIFKKRTVKLGMQGSKS